MSPSARDRRKAEVECPAAGGNHGPFIMRDTRDAASRHQLTGLVATYRAHHYDLDIFTDDEARELLASHIGRDRIDAEPDTVTRLLAYCAGLPLAISIVAARASIHWRLSLSTIVDELHSHTERLDGFDGGDPATDLGRVLSWSYDALPVEAAAVFELLGLVPGPDISLPAIASLTKLSPAQAQKTLRALDNAYLV